MPGGVSTASGPLWYKDHSSLPSWMSSLIPWCSYPNLPASLSQLLIPNTRNNLSSSVVQFASWNVSPFVLDKSSYNTKANHSSQWKSELNITYSPGSLNWSWIDLSFCSMCTACLCSCITSKICRTAPCLLKVQRGKTDVSVWLRKRRKGEVSALFSHKETSILPGEFS
jgi:hypothetical protein